MKAAYVRPLLLTFALAACAHAPKPYTFSSKQAVGDVDVVVRTLQESGLRPAQIDRNLGIVTTYWFDTGYPFRETNIRETIQYPTNVFLRYRINLRREGGKETVVLDIDAQRCASLDSTVTVSGVTGTCEPMTSLFPTQQKQAEALGEKLRQALHGTVAASPVDG